MDPAVSLKKFERDVARLREDADELTRSLGWELKPAEQPILDVVFKHQRSSRRVGFRFRFENWAEAAPSLTLFDPESGELLPWEKWPQGVWAVGNPHPTTGKPFLCLPGIYEYHIHPSHLNDPWSNYSGRESYKLGHLVHRVWQRFRDTNG
jgi:hypothetical protein